MTGKITQFYFTITSLTHTRYLELVRVFMTERERENFVLDEADFADVAGSYGEKIQRSIK